MYQRRSARSLGSTDVSAVTSATGSGAARGPDRLRGGSRMDQAERRLPQSGEGLVRARADAAAILAQRDVALTIAALSDIQRWMVEAARGRSPDD